MRLTDLNKLIKGFQIVGIADWPAYRLIALASYIEEQGVATVEDFKTAVEQYKTSVR